MGSRLDYAMLDAATAKAASMTVAELIQLAERDCMSHLDGLNLDARWETINEWLD